MATDDAVVSADALQAALARKGGFVDEGLPAGAEADRSTWQTGARAEFIPDLDAARAHFAGCVWGDLALVSPPDAGPTPFLDAAPARTGSSLDSPREFAWKAHEMDDASSRFARRGRLEDRRVRGVELRENGLLLCGADAEVPRFVWDPAEKMRDDFGGQYHDPNLRSHGRKPTVLGLEGCGDMRLSLLPSVSGGYALTQENVPKNLDLLLCLHKSDWRDRLVLEEGMEIEIGSNPETRLLLGVMSITSESPRVTSLDLSMARASTQVGAAGGSGKKSVRFGDSTELETGVSLRRSKSSPEHGSDSRRRSGTSGSDASRSHISRFPDDDDPEDEDLMATAPIWASGLDHDRTSRARHRSRPLSAGGAPSRRPKSTAVLKAGHQQAAAAAAPQQPRSKLVFRYQIGDGPQRTEPFVPPPDTGDGVKTPRRDSVRTRRRQMFTIGGASTCNIVLPGCPVAIVASIVALDNVFSLLCPSALSDTFHRGAKLSDSELLFARLTSVHLLLDREGSWGLYDGDALVLRDNARPAPPPARGRPRAAVADGCDCCAGAEIHVRLSDPTERRRLKRNKKLLELNGLRAGPTAAIVPLGRHHESWVRRALFATEPAARRKDPGRVVLQSLALEVRAPVRVSQWDGGGGWRYGDTEAFALEGITLTSDATIGASPMMTLSVKDPRMGRCHASIFRKNAARASKGAFLMEASRAAGNKALLRLIGASVPPGLGSAASPPHLLLTGEVFRVGASEFKVIGFTKAERGGGPKRRQQPTREPLGAAGKARARRAVQQQQRPSVTGQQTPQQRAAAMAAATRAGQGGGVGGDLQEVDELGRQERHRGSRRQALSQRLKGGLQKFGSMFRPSHFNGHEPQPQLRLESTVEERSRDGGSQRSSQQDSSSRGRPSDKKDKPEQDGDDEDDDGVVDRSDAEATRVGDNDDLDRVLAVGQLGGSTSNADAAGASDACLRAAERDDDDDEEEEDNDEERDAAVARAESNRRLAEERLASMETTQFQSLQSEGDAHMRDKLDRPGSVALVRHRPNEEDPAKVMKIATSYTLEDEETEVHVIDNTDKSFGLARIDEYEHVLAAFGLDEDTRGITFPELDSFMVLQCIKGPLLRRIFLIDTNECTIGGSPGCSIAVPNDPLISALHCRIVFHDVERHWRLVDCQSRTGTFLRTTPEDDAVLLQPGQRFLLGHTQIRVLGRQRGSRSGRSGGGAIRRRVKSVAAGAVGAAAAAASSAAKKASGSKEQAQQQQQQPEHDDAGSNSEEESGSRDDSPVNVDGLLLHKDDDNAGGSPGSPRSSRRSYDTREPPFSEDEDPFLAAALRDLRRDGSRRRAGGPCAIL